MKRLPSTQLAVFWVLLFVFSVRTQAQAQAPESIWLTAGTTSFMPGETVTVTVNAISGTPIQGFNIQMRYDPACLQPGETTTPIPGMSLLSLPQTAGLVEATFASTMPQTANGVLTEVPFTALAECQTSLTLESAALAVKNADGFAVPLVGMTMGQQTVMLAVGRGAAITAVPPTEIPPQAALSIPTWMIVLLVLLGILILFVIFKMIQSLPGGTRD
jgi:hypothetical protein